MANATATLDRSGITQKVNFSAEDLQKLQLALAERTKVISQNDLAKQMGVNPGTLSFVKNGKWENLSEQMISQMWSFFKISDWKIRRTPNFMAITELCEDARMNRRFLATAGFTGAGKTVALRNYAAKHEDCFYVLATQVMTKRGFVNAMLKAMALTEEGNIEERIERIASKLNKGIRSLLLIDDVGKLNDACFSVLQIIFDSTEGNAGLVVAGTEYLKKLIDKNAKKDKLGYRELKRRIAYWLPLDRPNREVIIHFASEFGIDENSALKVVCERCTDYGTLQNVLTNARMKATELGVKIDKQLLLGLHCGETHYES